MLATDKVLFETVNSLYYRIKIWFEKKNSYQQLYVAPNQP